MVRRCEMEKRGGVITACSTHNCIFDFIPKWICEYRDWVICMRDENESSFPRPDTALHSHFSTYISIFLSVLRNGVLWVNAPAPYTAITQETHITRWCERRVVHIRKQSSLMFRFLIQHEVRQYVCIFRYIGIQSTVNKTLYCLQCQWTVDENKRYGRMVFKTGMLPIRQLRLIEKKTFLTFYVALPLRSLAYTNSG